MLVRQEHDCIVIRGARIIDPASNLDRVGDVFIEYGKLALGSEIRNGSPVLIPHSEFRTPNSPLIVCPGLWDIHVHLREPGGEHKETIETGTRAAAAGGFTFIASMPNTAPAIDTPEMVAFVLERALAAGYCAVGPVAAITHGRAGKTLTDFQALQTAGAVAFSDDGVGVEDDAMMDAAFRQARALGGSPLRGECEEGAVLIQHCEYKAISAGGVMHLGEVSRRLGLPGLDPRSEEAMIERDLALCRRHRARYHVAHISTARAVEMVRQAKAEGLPVTAEVCTHHLILTDEACLCGTGHWPVRAVQTSEGPRDRGPQGPLSPQPSALSTQHGSSDAHMAAVPDPNTKMHPPLRPQGDVDACRRGLLDGTIDCIVTDHAPHTAAEKAAGFLKAPAGIIGLETAIGVAARAMIDTGLADWPDLIRWFTCGPARVLGKPPPSLTPGAAAELTLIDPKCTWTVQPERMESRSRNTPFGGWTLTGRAVGTIRGRVVLQPTS